MFAKLSALALLLPLVAGITINPLSGATSAGTVTITWTASTSDPQYFSIELVNTAFNDEFAIANNVQTSLGSITITLPQVPDTAGYTLAAIATNDVNTIYSTSGSFSIGAETTSTSASAASTSSASTSSGTPLTFSTLSTISSTASVPSTTASISPASSVSSASSQSGSSASASGTSTATASSSPSSLSSGAAPFKMLGAAPMAALALSAVAGAAMVL